LIEYLKKNPQAKGTCLEFYIGELGLDGVARGETCGYCGLLVKGMFKHHTSQCGRNRGSYRKK